MMTFWTVFMPLFCWAVTGIVLAIWGIVYLIKRVIIPLVRQHKENKKEKDRQNYSQLWAKSAPVIDWVSLNSFDELYNAPDSVKEYVSELSGQPRPKVIKQRKSIA